MNIIFRVLIPIVAFICAACGPSSDDEIQNWNNNRDAINKYGKEWPGFKPHLDKRLKRAEPAWEEALKIADEKEKVEKLKGVNAMLDPLVAHAIEVGAKIASIESTMDEIYALKLPYFRADSRDESVSDADSSLSEIKNALSTADPETDEDAVALLEEKISSLASLQDRVDRLYHEFKPKEEVKEKNRKKDKKKKKNRKNKRGKKDKKKDKN